jgi:hypothetical protein
MSVHSAVRLLPQMTHFRHAVPERPLCVPGHLSVEPASPPHFFLSLNWMGTVSMSLRDTTMSLVDPRNFWKCGDS